MTFTDDYNTILGYAKNKVYSLGLTISPEDLINDAYLKLYDTPYLLGNYRKEISNIALIEKHNKPNDISYGIAANKNRGYKGDSTCVFCKQIKTAQEFRIERRMFGKESLRTMCIVCEGVKIREKNFIVFGVKYNKDQYEKAKVTDKFKEKNKKRVSKYVKANRVKWNAYIKERYRLKKLNLLPPSTPHKPALHKPQF